MTLLSWLAAFLLDWRLGDPEHWPHPIRWIGNAIRKTEGMIRRRCQSGAALRRGGAVLWIVIVGTWAVSYGVLALAFYLETSLGWLVTIWMTYTVLATRCLQDAAMRVYDALKADDLAESREKLSWIVGRDTGADTAANHPRGNRNRRGKYHRRRDSPAVLLITGWRAAGDGL